MRSVFFVLVVAVAGFAILMSLGFWQLRRLEWKEGLIARAEAMIAVAPVPLPAAPDPGHDRYRAVTVAGRFTGEEAHVLTASETGPGFLIVAAFETDDGRRILIDRGFVPEEARGAPRPAKPARVTGNLNWPDDMTSATPPYDAKADLWFGRDVAGIAARLKTLPILVVARDDTGDAIQAVPVTAVFRNNHLGYAIQWFGLAAVWAGMTVLYLWRIRTRQA